MQEKYKNLTKNTALFAISSFGTKILSFLIVPLYTNILTTSEYGIADIITTTGTLIMYICTLDIGAGVLRFVLDKKEDKENIFSFGARVLVYGSIVAIFILSSIWILGIFDWPAGYYIFTFFYFFFSATYDVISRYLRAVDKVKDTAIAGLISSFGVIFGNILFLLVFKIGMYGYMIALIMGPLFGTLYGVLKSELRSVNFVKCTCDKGLKSEILRYCIPLIFNNLALWINAFLDKYFITAMIGSSENGIYSVASKIPNILSMCYVVFSQAWTLSAIKEFDKDDKDGFFGNTYNLFNAMICIVCSGIILFNVPLAKFLYAKDFFAAWQYSSVLLISVMFNSLTTFLGSLFSAVKKSRTIMTTTILSAVVNTVLNAILIPSWGALGAAIATAVAYLVMWAARLIKSREFIKMRITIKTDILVYILLALQVFFEHLEGHWYPTQVAIVVAIVLIHRKYLGKIFSTIVRVGKGKRSEIE